MHTNLSQSHPPIYAQNRCRLQWTLRLGRCELSESAYQLVRTSPLPEGSRRISDDHTIAIPPRSPPHSRMPQHLVLRDSQIALSVGLAGPSTVVASSQVPIATQTEGSRVKSRWNMKDFEAPMIPTKKNFSHATLVSHQLQGPSVELPASSAKETTKGARKGKGKCKAWEDMGELFNFPPPPASRLNPDGTLKDPELGPSTHFRHPADLSYPPLTTIQQETPLQVDATKEFLKGFVCTHCRKANARRYWASLSCPGCNVSSAHVQKSGRCSDGSRTDLYPL